MNLYRTIIVALKALRRNPTRASLTTLGIVIGIAAVITMMEIGKPLLSKGSNMSVMYAKTAGTARTVWPAPYRKARCHILPTSS